MTIKKTKNGNILNVSVDGRVDTSTAPEFETAVKSDIEGVTELNIDFSKLSYISSAGLRCLLSLQKIMNNQGTLIITGANETVVEIFEVTGFSEILTIK